MILIFVLVAYAIILTILVELENGSGATAATLILLSIIGWICKGSFSELGQYVSNNALEVVLYVLGYIVSGVLWSFYKWYLYLLRYKAMHKGWTTISIPKVDKSTAIMYMSYWVPSFVWYVIHKPITKIYTAIYKLVSKSYENLAKRILTVKQ